MMRKIALFSLLAFVIPSAPAFCQTKVYTNADLGGRVTWTAPPPSAETLAGLSARQFVWYPTYDGPTFYVGQQPKNMSGPKPLPARRLDGSLMSDPPTIYGLSPFYPYPYPYPSYSFGSQRSQHHHRR